MGDRTSSWCFGLLVGCCCILTSDMSCPETVGIFRFMSGRFGWTKWWRWAQWLSGTFRIPWRRPNGEVEKWNHGVMDFLTSFLCFFRFLADIEKNGVNHQSGMFWRQWEKPKRRATAESKETFTWREWIYWDLDFGVDGHFWCFLFTVVQMHSPKPKIFAGENPKLNSTKRRQVTTGTRILEARRASLWSCCWMMPPSHIPKEVINLSSGLGVESKGESSVFAENHTLSYPALRSNSQKSPCPNDDPNCVD